MLQLRYALVYQTILKIDKDVEEYDINPQSWKSLTRKDKYVILKVEANVRTECEKTITREVIQIKRCSTNNIRTDESQNKQDDWLVGKWIKKKWTNMDKNKNEPTFKINAKASL